MISQFRETHLLSSPFTSKSLAFVANKVLSPTGTRLNVYQLDKNRLATTQIGATYNIRLMAASKDGATIVLVDEEQNLYIKTNNSIIHMKSKFRVSAIKFSPDGKMIALARGNQLVVYAAPTLDKSLQKLSQIKKLQNKHSSDIKGLQWSPDGRFILTWGDDNSVIINAVFKLQLYQDIVFQSHKFPIVNAFYLNNRVICTLDQLGKLCIWRWVQDFVSDGYLEHQRIQQVKKGRNINKNQNIQPNSSLDYEDTSNLTEMERLIHKGRFILSLKKNFKEGKIKSAEYHHQQRLLLIGQRNGTIHIHRLEQPELIESDKQLEGEFLTQLQTFQIAEAPIDAIAFNDDGNWIALGLKLTGQLIVWEWRSQSYILNQSQLSYEITSMCMSSSLISTGSVGGVIRLWDSQSMLCVAKFAAENPNTDMQSHSSKITGMVMDSRKSVVLSCSLDGTVRAFDTLRLKCFRVMKPEIPNQLNCIAYEGEIVCVGGFDPYEIYCFNLQRGQLVEVIAGHTAPVVGLTTSMFEETVLMISASWDKTVRVHDLYTRASRTGSGGDIFQHNSDITAIAVRNDGLQLTTSTMKGELLIWDVSDSQIIGTIDIDRDIQGGRASHELVSAQNNTNKKHFTTLCYSQEGTFLLGGGNSKYVCLYDMRFRVLMKKFIISNNHSLEGIDVKLNFNKQLQTYSEEEERKDDNLPGAKIYDVTKRSSKKIPIQVFKVEFSSSNQQFVVAHSEGVSVYGTELNKLEIFDPLLSDESVNVNQIQLFLEEQNHTDALIYALKLNQISVIKQVLERVDDIEKVVQGVPNKLLPRLISVIDGNNIQKNLRWIKSILIIKKKDQSILNGLKEIQRKIRAQFSKIDDVALNCINLIDFLTIQYELGNQSMEIET